MADQILSLQNLEEIDEYLAQFNSEIVQYYELLNDAITKFETVPVTQSLYESGNFGQAQKEEILNLKKGLERYVNSLTESGALVHQTKNFVNTQRDLLMKQSYGYTASDSVSSRREGNSSGYFFNN